MTDTVAAVIPVYNRRKVLIRALESVFSQSHPVDEIIVVDDASDLAVEDFLRAAGMLRGDFTVIRSDQHLGGAGARNLGVSTAASGLVAFLDSDDYWLPDKIRRQVHALQSDADAALVFCDRLHSGTRSRRTSDRTLYEDNILDHLLDGWMNFPNTSSLMFRRKAFQELGGFDSSLASCQDHDLWMRIGEADLHVVAIREPLYVTAGGTENSISSTYSARRSGIQRFVEKWAPLIQQRRGSIHAADFERRYYASALSSIFVASLLKADWQTSWDILKLNMALRNSRFVGAIAQYFMRAARRRIVKTHIR